MSRAPEDGLAVVLARQVLAGIVADLLQDRDAVVSGCVVVASPSDDGAG